MSNQPKGKEQAGSGYGFDSSGFEKAASAAKYLDQSKNAQTAFELTKTQEETKQLGMKENYKKLEIQQVQIAEEQRRQTKKFEHEMEQVRLEKQAQLSLQTEQQKIGMKEQMRQQRREADEESTARQEQMRRQTLEYEYQLKASIKQQALNQQREAEMEREQVRYMNSKDLAQQDVKDKRETQRQLFITAFNTMGNGFYNLMNNPKILMKMLYISVIGFGAYQTTKVGAALMGKSAMARFGKPTLVRETSKIHTRNPFALPFLYARKQSLKLMRRSENDLLAGVILDKRLESQLREISYAVLNRRKHFAPCKNMMFYGPPGTGKTLFAKKLAAQSGLEYSVMVGSDIAPLGADGVTELNKIFDWAQRQRGGMILFIDEADAFLRNRKSEEMSEEMRHCINSFLYHTGSPSEKVIVVLATNAPNQLDEAVHDRIDEIVGFDRPSKTERQTMLFHYMVKYCQPPQTPMEQAAFIWKYPSSILGKKLIRMEGIDQELIQDIAEKTEGFSGREIVKMVVAWHDAAFTLPDATLRPDVMKDVLHKFRLQHKLKDTWTQAEAMLMTKNIDLGSIKAGSAEVTIDASEDQQNDKVKDIEAEIEKDRVRMRNRVEKQTDDEQAAQDKKN